MASHYIRQREYLPSYSDLYHTYGPAGLLVVLALYLLVNFIDSALQPTEIEYTTPTSRTTPADLVLSRLAYDASSLVTCQELICPGRSVRATTDSGLKETQPPFIGGVYVTASEPQCDLEDVQPDDQLYEQFTYDADPTLLLSPEALEVNYRIQDIDPRLTPPT